MSKKHAWSTTALLDTLDECLSADTLTATTPEESIDKALALLMEMRDDAADPGIIEPISCDVAITLDLVVRALTGCPVAITSGTLIMGMDDEAHEDMWAEMVPNERYLAYVDDYRRGPSGALEYGYFTDIE